MPLREKEEVIKRDIWKASISHLHWLITRLNYFEFESALSEIALRMYRSLCQFIFWMCERMKYIKLLTALAALYPCGSQWCWCHHSATWILIIESWDLPMANLLTAIWPTAWLTGIEWCSWSCSGQIWTYKFQKVRRSYSVFLNILSSQNQLQLWSIHLQPASQIHHQRSLPTLGKETNKPQNSYQFIQMHHLSAYIFKKKKNLEQNLLHHCLQNV